MEVVHVRLKKRSDDSYPIFIGQDLFSFIAHDLKKRNIGNKYAIIADTTSSKLFGKKLVEEIQKVGLTVSLIAFKEGEQNKNLKIYAEIMEAVARADLDRKSAIIGLGGGVSGDLAGFVAATYMRGIRYVHVPTTLLAMVDSSIGGKTGVDLRERKNAAGAFHQPQAVYSDIATLNSLPRAQISSGLAEIIKHGVIADKKLFSFIEENNGKIMSKNNNVLIHSIKENARIKGSIIEKDEKEGDLRVVLNYGHTIGHAIESLTKYKKFSHGEAIAIGMNVAAHISMYLNFMPKEDVERQKKLLKNAGLPVSFPTIHPAAIINELHKDKKSFGHGIVFTLPERIGKVKRIKNSYRISVDKAMIRKAIEACK